MAKKPSGKEGGAPGGRDAVRFAINALERGTDALREMCALRRADAGRIKDAILPIEAARRGGVVIDGVPCSMWGVYDADDADEVCDVVQVFENAWRDFAKAFDFPRELSERLAYVLNSMCDPGGGAMAGTVFAEECAKDGIYKNFTPANFAENVLRFRMELESLVDPRLTPGSTRHVNVGGLHKEPMPEMELDCVYWASKQGRAYLRSAIARIVPNYKPPKAGKRESERLADDAKRYGVMEIILASKRYGDDFITLLCNINAACDALDRLCGIVESATAADIRREFRKGCDWVDVRHIFEGEYLKERGYYSGDKFGDGNKIDEAWARFDCLAFKLMDAIADRFGSATAAELCELRQDFSDYLSASDNRTWHIGCEKLAYDIIAKERTEAQKTIAGIVRRMTVMIECGAAELAKTEAATARDMFADGSAVEKVGEKSDGAEAVPRDPKTTDEAKYLQILHIFMEVADDDLRIEWYRADKILQQETLEDWDHIPVRMFDDAGNSLGQKRCGRNEPGFDAFKKMIQRAKKEDMAYKLAKMAQLFVEKKWRFPEKFNDVVKKRLRSIGWLNARQ